MKQYAINKGVGKSVEFKGIRAQYFLGLVLGVLVSFALFFLCSFLFGQWVAVTVGLLAGLVSFIAVYTLNARFGEHGLMHRLASRYVPQRLANSRRTYRMIRICR